MLRGKPEIRVGTDSNKRLWGACARNAHGKREQEEND
jgi:hypothetical protein